MVGIIILSALPQSKCWIIILIINTNVSNTSSFGSKYWHWFLTNSPSLIPNCKRNIDKVRISPMARLARIKLLIYSFISTCNCSIPNELWQQSLGASIHTKPTYVFTHTTNNTEESNGLSIEWKKIVMFKISTYCKSQG